MHVPGEPHPHPNLSRSVKGRFPFRLGAPSYIYPDRMLPNVRMLSPHLDEIELLFFESAPPEGLPSPQEIDAIARVLETAHATANIHLPTDLSLGASDPGERARAAEIFRRIVDLTAPLRPVTWTLHLPYPGDGAGPRSLSRWRDNCSRGLDLFLAKGPKGPAVSVETLSYPFSHVRPIVDAFDLSVCVDTGHLILQGIDPETVFAEYRDRTTILHIHGVCGSKDHLSLGNFAPEQSESLRRILSRFTGSVSIEVFSYPDLETSLRFFDS